MIERYSLSPMRELWSEEAKYERWLRVELAVVEAQRDRDEIPADEANEILEKAVVNVPRILEIESEIGHDVLSFVRQLEESVGPAGRYIHKGLTSYDVVDTALSLALKEGIELLEDELASLNEIVKTRANEHKDTLMIGRTHGMQAEPITFGLLLLVWHGELTRNLKRLEYAKSSVSYGKISGSVGTYANIDPAIEPVVCEKLGLKPTPISNQILQRDNHAEVLSTLAIVAGTIEKMAVNIRHLHRTEVGEVREGKAHPSSSMPHKQNPSTSETISGLVRLVRANALAGLENMAVWHEQDLSRSSVERIIIPDSYIALHYMLRKMTEVITHLQVNKEKMRANVELNLGGVFSQAVLLRLIDKGMPRKEAHNLIRSYTIESERSGTHLKELLLEDDEIRVYLVQSELEELFDFWYHLKHVDEIFERFG